MGWREEKPDNEAQRSRSPSQGRRSRGRGSRRYRDDRDSPAPRSRSPRARSRSRRRGYRSPSQSRNRDAPRDSPRRSREPRRSSREANSRPRGETNDAETAGRSRSAPRRQRSRSRASREGEDRAKVTEDENSKKKSRRSKWDVSEDKPPTATPDSAAAAAVTGSLSSLLKTGDEPKQNSLFGAAPGHMGAPRHTVEIDEKWMSHVLGGPNGEGIRKIETDTGCCVRFDNTRAADGNTLCKVFGSESVAQMGYDLVRVRLAEVCPEQASLPTTFVTRTIDVEHSAVGAVMGKNGELLREMSAASGAIMTFERDKPGREGCDELKIVGQKDQVDLAERLINQKLDEALTIKFGHEQFGEPESTIDINVEQQFIGWVMGKSKETIKHITQSSHTTIHVKQFMKTKGFSVIRVMGPRTSVEQAHQMIEKRVEQGRRYQEDKKAQFLAGDWICTVCGTQNYRRSDTCKNCGARKANPNMGADGGNSNQPEATFLKRECDDAFKVDQRWVGYIIGPGGKTFKEIKETSGAKVYIDQETKDQGFSVVRIGDSGTPENLLARELILKRMKECKALPAEQRRGIYQQSLHLSQQVSTPPQGQVVPPPPQGGVVGNALPSTQNVPAQGALPSPVPQQPGLVASVSKQQPYPNAMMKAPMPVPPKSATPAPANPVAEIWSDDFAQKYFEAAFDQIYNNGSLDPRSKLEKLEGTIAVAKQHLAPHMEATLRRIIDNVKSTLES